MKNLIKKLVHRNPAIKKDNVLIIDDYYPFVSKPRYYAGKPNIHLYNIIDRNRTNYANLLREFIEYKDKFNNIQINFAAKDTDPVWENGWIPALDSMSLYVLLTKYNPTSYIEIGSGNSTKFARKAIIDSNLKTRITSIDPHPVAEIDKICDKIIRKNLEDVELDIFDTLWENDILFVDNSHRLFMNSDSTVTFLDILPRLRKGVLVEFHDICLPYDYPEDWINRYYSEQYGLACYMLAEGDKFEVVLPNKFVVFDHELMSGLNELWNYGNLKKTEKNGCSFWIRILK
ncbi:MAG: class I SAM-dependent methyltransferase [Nitrospirota bacterium]